MKYMNWDSVTKMMKQFSALIVSTGVSDANKIVATDATGRLDPSVMPVGIGADTATLPASENLAAGDFVNIWDNAGTPSVRKADATAQGKEADGFVLAAVTAPANATVYFEGRNTSLTGMTPGVRQFLSAASPGRPTETPPNSAGNVVQYLGRAYSATELAYEGDAGIILQ